MKNYTDNNLIAVPYSSVPTGTLAIKVGNNVFLAGGGSQTDFYKCSSVDSTNHTWAGYRAVLNDGVYTFESTVTTGLTYSSGAFTPEVGNIYNDGAMIKAELITGIPVDGLIFYAPLTSAEATAETGQAISYTDCNFTTVSGIGCMQCSNGSSVATSTVTNIPQGANARTISFWGYAESYLDDWMAFLTYGTDASMQLVAIRTYQDSASMGFSFSDWNSNVAVAGAWHHFALTYNGTVVTLYVDGVSAISQTLTLDTDGTTLNIGQGVNTDTSLRGYITALRVYGRALTSNEINSLASEFTPTV